MVRCADCGFLAVEHPLESEPFAEADDTVRKTGLVQSAVLYHHMPVCFVRVIDLRAELPESADSGKILHALQAERDCAKFIKWWPSYTPKEHAEMQREEELRERDRRWRQEDIELLKAGMFWVPIAVALLGILGTLAGAIVGGLLSR